MDATNANQQGDRIEGKLDVLAEHVSELRVAAAQHEATLTEHMRRTELLEEVVKPLQAHVVMVAAIAKVLAGAGASLGFVLGCVKVWAALHAH